MKIELKTKLWESESTWMLKFKIRRMYTTLMINSVFMIIYVLLWQYMYTARWILLGLATAHIIRYILAARSYKKWDKTRSTTGSETEKTTTN